MTFRPLVFQRVLACLGGLLLVIGLVGPLPAAWAGPVDWREVPATAAGRQWWDAGSLRLSPQGQLTVLSRFQPSPPEPMEGAAPERAPAGRLYVMELDCDQELYRDISVNGLPRFRAEWQAPAGDALTMNVVRAACRAGADRLAASGRGEFRDG